MGNFIFICPFCDQKLECDSSLDNAIVSCPTCSNEICPSNEKSASFDGRNTKESEPNECSPVDEISKLQELLNKGIISEEEFCLLKSKIIKNHNTPYQRTINEQPTEVQVGYASKTNKKCPYCKKDVEDGAVVCPYCQSTFISRDPIKNLIGMAILFIVLYFLISSFVSCESEREIEKINRDIERETQKLNEDIERETQKLDREIQKEMRKYNF